MSASDFACLVNFPYLSLGPEEGQEDQGEVKELPVAVSRSYGPSDLPSGPKNKYRQFTKQAKSLADITRTSGAFNGLQKSSLMNPYGPLWPLITPYGPYSPL